LKSLLTSYRVWFILSLWFDLNYLLCVFSPIGAF
jgi:hypothetical protein